MLLLMLIQTESHRLLTRGVMGLEQTVKGTAVVIMLHKKAFGMLPLSRLSFGVLPDCRELKLALCSFLAECSGDEHSQILLSFTVTQQVCWSWWWGELLNCSVVSHIFLSCRVCSEVDGVSSLWGDTEPLAKGLCKMCNLHHRRCP